MRAFVLAEGDDRTARIAAALVKAYPDWDVVAPAPRDGREPQDYIRWEVTAAMDSDVIVMGVGAELMVHSVAVAAPAASLGVDFKRIEQLVAGWKPEREVEVK